MSRAPAFRQADVTRLLKGALAAGLPVGSFKLVVDKDGLTILPIATADAPAASSDVAKALSKWRRSA